MKMHGKAIVGMVAASALFLSACGASNTGGADGQSDNGGNKDNAYSASAFKKKFEKCDVHAGTKDVSDVKGTGDDDKKIQIGAFNGWAESFAVSYLMQNILEKKGYDVTIKNYDAGPMFTGVAGGDIDLTMDVWLPVTHKSYIQRYGKKMEDLGCWYDNAKLTLAVNKKSPAKSIADLNKDGNPEDYNKTIYGIDPGAGLTKQTKEHAIPDYNLSKNYDFKISSTPAMLTQIKKTQQQGKDVLVTLWRPHWAYSKYPMRDLKDPKHAMGGTEYIHSFARSGFEKDYPHAAQIFKNFVFSDKNLAPLEELFFAPDEADSDQKKYPAMVKKWLKQNPNFEKKLMSGTL